MLKQNKIVIKKFLLSIKNAIMAMSVESLKESFLQEVLDNFRAMNTLKDSGFDMDSPIMIKVGERKEIKVFPSFDPEVWIIRSLDPNIVVTSRSGFLEGVSEGRTILWGKYFKDGADPEAQFEESSIEVIVEASNSPDIDDGDIGSDIPGITPSGK